MNNGGRMPIEVAVIMVGVVLIVYCAVKYVGHENNDYQKLLSRLDAQQVLIDDLNDKQKKLSTFFADQLAAMKPQHDVQTVNMNFKAQEPIPVTLVYRKAIPKAPVKVKK